MVVGFLKVRIGTVSSHIGAQLESAFKTSKKMNHNTTPVAD
jgi:hypothetical protein